MKVLRVLAGILGAALGTLALAAARVPAPPDLFLLPVADASRGGSAILAMCAGLTAGLLEDALTVPGRLLGLHAFSKILIGYALATIGARTIVEKPAAVAGVLGAAVLVDAGLVALLLWILRGDPSFPAPTPVAARVTTTALFGGAVHAISRMPWRARWEARRRRRLG